MPRSGEDARRRLQGAALELWAERGYDRATTAEIAAKAGVAERTFFRHFPDKREVLFDGAVEMRDVLVSALANAPRDMAPLEALRQAFRAVKPLFERNYPYSALRQKVIVASPALQEREAAKATILASALAETLQHRGVEPRLSTLVAQVGMAAFGYAVASWMNDPLVNLDIHLENAFEQLGALSLESDARSGGD